METEIAYHIDGNQFWERIVMNRTLQFGFVLLFLFLAACGPAEMQLALPTVAPTDILEDIEAPTSEQTDKAKVEYLNTVALEFERLFGGQGIKR